MDTFFLESVNVLEIGPQNYKTQKAWILYFVINNSNVYTRNKKNSKIWLSNPAFTLLKQYFKFYIYHNYMKDGRKETVEL